MKKNQALLVDPGLSRHIPETVWYNSQSLKEMLGRYSVIYIKPDTGKQGNSIIRVRSVSKSECELSFNNSVENLPLSKLTSRLDTVMGGRRYIIQQGIDLATVKNCPFDIRMVLQKPYSAWELTLTSAKVALREDAVVTNVSRGAQDYPLLDVLQNYDQKQEPMIIYRELIDKAHQIANILGSKFPLRIVGLDMAIDKKGAIWFIEANTQPQCARCKLVNDEVYRSKYEEAKKIIRGET